MFGLGVGASVRGHVVPDEQPAQLRRHGEVEEAECCRSAPLGDIEVDHRGPGALATLLAVLLPIRLVDVEEVGMLLELLASLVALSLKRLAVRTIDPDKASNARVYFRNKRIVGI